MKSDTNDPPVPPATPVPCCLRCHRALPVDDDGFCDDCRKALEEACL
jgi:hypothetical protein